MDFTYSSLQNGSDIRGVALDMVPGEPVNLTDDVVKNIAIGFAYFLSENLSLPMDQLRVSVGRDSRISGKHIAEIVCTALQSMGICVLDTGMASTPAMFFSTILKNFSCNGAIMITASHLPPNRNGFKFFTSDGGLDSAAIADIINVASRQTGASLGLSPETYENSTPHQTNSTSLPAIEKSDIISTYSQELQKMILGSLNKGSYPLSNLKIVVDAGNGAAGFYATQVLEPLGADISESLYLEPDGFFPNHVPNPEKASALIDLQEVIRTTGADLGLVFDTDVDRAAAIDEKGNTISRNGIIAMAAALIAEEHPHTTVVTDSITSPQLTEFLENKLSMKHFRYKRGYRNVISKAIQLNEKGIDSQLAIETSGHAAYKENYFLDDGAFLATKIVIATAKLKSQGKGISFMIDELKEPAIAREFRMPIHEVQGETSFLSNGNKVLSDLADYIKTSQDLGVSVKLAKPNYEGVRLEFNHGWLLVRLSLHDPIMPINIESEEKDGVEKILKFIKPFLDKYPFLDTTILKK